MQLQEDQPLAPLTTLRIGGAARWFVTARSEADVEQAVAFARERHLPVFVLGGGSNLLVADSGFPGLVLHMAITGMESADGEQGKVLVRAGAGESWEALVQYTVDRELAGMECLAGIPGTVGGTPVQNVGAYGQEVAETIHTVRCFDLQALCFVNLSREQCGFAYRTSLFNTSHRGRYAVTRVDFAMQPGGSPRLSYADLRKRFEAAPQPSLRQTAEAVRQIRRSKSMVIDPDDPNTRSAGSFFRNPLVPSGLLPRVAEAAGVSEGDVPHWPAKEGSLKLAAAWLLERAGFVRGFQMGRAGISTRHTLALINRGGATAADIVELRDEIVRTVQERFGVELEQEPVSLG